MIAAIAIDDPLRSVHKSSHGVAFLYCNYKEDQNMTCMLATILKQLLQPDMKPTERLHQQHVRSGESLSLDEMLQALQDVLVCYTTVHVVVDALDE
jgi:hypothetical protein